MTCSHNWVSKIKVSTPLLYSIDLHLSLVYEGLVLIPYDGEKPPAAACLVITVNTPAHPI